MDRLRPLVEAFERRSPSGDSARERRGVELFQLVDL